MYRLHNDSRVGEPVYHEDTPFFREMITLIDECTKLMRDDRIALRNQVKQYLRQLRQNKPREEDDSQYQTQNLIQIFIDTNKKRSLGKIRKGDRAMDALQVSLRKFVEGCKKEKHRKEVETYRRGRAAPSQHQRVGQAPSERAFKSKVNLPRQFKQSQKKYEREFKLNGSRNRSIDPPRPVSTHSYSSQSYHKKFDYLRKKKDQVTVQPILKPVRQQVIKKRPSYSGTRSLNHSLDHFGQRSSRVSQKNSSHKKSTLPSKMVKDQIKPEEPSLTVGFTSQPYHVEPPKCNFPSFNNPFYAQPDFPMTFVQPSFTVEPVERLHSLGAELSSEKQPQVLEKSNDMSATIRNYEDSSRKIQELFENSKNKLASYGFNNSPVGPHPSPPSPHQHVSSLPSNNEDLFTPPELLAECKKFMLHSSRKSEERRDSFDLPGADYLAHSTQKKMTFSGLLGNVGNIGTNFEPERQQTPTIENTITHLVTSQARSEGVSANVSNNKPNSQVQFLFRALTAYSVEELLLDLFKNGCKTTLTISEINDMKTSMSLEVRNILEEYCDMLMRQFGPENTRLYLDFVDMVKCLDSWGKVSKRPDSISTLLDCYLDINKKGYINEEDVQAFVDSLRDSQIDEDCLQAINGDLWEVFRRACQVECGMIITRWSLFYLQLTGYPHIQGLKEQLSKFEFQIDQQE